MINKTDEHRQLQEFLLVGRGVPSCTESKSSGGPVYLTSRAEVVFRACFLEKCETYSCAYIHTYLFATCTPNHHPPRVHLCQDSIIVAGQIYVCVFFTQSNNQYSLSPVKIHIFCVPTGQKFFFLFKVLIFCDLRILQVLKLVCQQCR